jgi:hypothetical protein
MQVEPAVTRNRGLESLLTALSGTDTSTAIDNLRKLIETSSDSSIKERERGTGFSYLSVQCDLTHMKIPEDKKDRWIEIKAKELNDIHGIPIHSETLKKLMKSHLETEQEIGVGDTSKTSSDTLYVSQGGKTTAIHMHLKPVPNNGNQLDTFWGVVSASFQLAPDIIIIHHSEKDFFSSTSYDEIKYVDRAITHHDMASIYQIVGTNMVPIASRIALEQ